MLWVSTVPEDDLVPRVAGAEGSRLVTFTAPARHRPVHGTLTVDVREHQDRRLLGRLLRSDRVLSVTASDGWTQRVRLTGIRRVDTEEQQDGSLIAVATYSWISAAACN